MVNVKFSYDMSNIWDMEILSRGNSWMNSALEDELSLLIAKDGFYSAVNNVEMWSKISMNIFGVPMIEDGGEIIFAYSPSQSDLKSNAKFTKEASRIINSLEPTPFDKSSFPSLTVINISKNKISGTYFSESLEPSASNIAYNSIALLILLNAKK